MCGCLLHAPHWDLAHNPGMCPEWETNLWPFALQACSQSTELYQPGLFLKNIKYVFMYLQLCIEHQLLPGTILDSEDTFWSSKQTC